MMFGWDRSTAPDGDGVGQYCWRCDAWRFSQLELEDFETVINVNLRSVFIATQRAAGRWWARH